MVVGRDGRPTSSASSSDNYSDRVDHRGDNISVTAVRTPSTCSQKSSTASSTFTATCSPPSSPAASSSSAPSSSSAYASDDDVHGTGELPIKVALPSTSADDGDDDSPAAAPPRMYAKKAMIDFKMANGTSASYKADLRVRVRTIGLIGALLPGIGCYLCIMYSYLFQFEQVSNFTSTTCEDLHSPFPPVSFSIGVWKPQKYFWLVILTIHFPPRLLFGYVYKSQYRLGESEYRTRTWFPKMIRLQVRVMFLEAVGLIVLSIFDMETYFVIHAIAFAVWLISFNFNMLFNCILHYHSGIRDLTIAHKNIFYIKCTIFMIAYPFSWSTAFTYFSYVAFCSSLAFALFAIAEYVLIGCNCLFYFLLVWELTGSRLEFFVTHKNCTTRTELDVI